MREPLLRHIPIRTLVLIGIVTLCNPLLHAQSAEKKLSLQLKDASLAEFIKLIEKKTDFSFIYGEEIKLERSISMDIKNKTLHEILRQAFLNEPISYKITGKHILLQRVQPKPVANRKYTISGYVTDRTSGETLIGAHVLESNRQQGATTNPYGYYTITLPGGEARLSFSYLGYDTQQCHFTLNKDTVIHIRLTSNNVLEEIVIVSDKVESGIRATHTGSIEIPIVQIKNTPSILGEADIMKTIQLMPGVQAGVEGSAGLLVRGGSPDQNLILLDGVPIYNVDHLFGFFSVFTPEAVKKVTFFKSSFPARFGGRLSSVVDVRTNDGDMQNYHGLISLGLLTSKLHFEGPIIKNRTSFNISLRRTYLDVVTRPFMEDDAKGGYYFYDINAKVNHRFSDKSRIYLSLYNGKDAYNLSSIEESSGNPDDEYYSMTDDKIKMSWGNTILSARWNYVLSNKLFSNTTIAYNEYTLHTDAKSYMKYNALNSTYRTDYNSGIRDLSYQVDFDYDPVPTHHVKFGAGYLFHTFRPEVMTSKVSEVNEAGKLDTIYRPVSNSQIQAHEFSVYAEDNFDLTSRLRTNIGVHLSAFHVQGKSYFSLQPRLSARYQLTKGLALKASYSKMNQYINLLSSAPISMPTDLWVPVTKNIKPMRAHQYTVGAYYTGFKGWEFSVETYYKDMYNILEYKDATRFIGSSENWEKKVEMGRGRSYGIEFMAQRTLGRTTGWVAYTLAKSDRKFAKGGINDGERFPFKYDRRHNVSLMVNHKFSDKIDIGASWQFATGGTTTIAQETTSIILPTGGYYFLPTGGYYFYDSSGNMITGRGMDNTIVDADYVESRNNYRLPPSHLLNIGVNFNKKTKHGMRTWNFSIHNVYNAMNPTFVHRALELEYPENGQGYDYKVKMKKFTLLPFIPSVSYTYKF